MQLFSLDEIANKPKNPDSKSDILREQFLTIHEQKVESIKDLHGRFPGENEIFFLWTVNSFNAFTFIPYIIRYCGQIEHLIISTYSINTRIVDSFIKYYDKREILKVDILISDSMKFRMPKVVDYLNSMLNCRPGIQISYGWNHSKVTLMKTSEHFFVSEGSGNWSENAKNEQYIFLNSKQVFDFRAKWIIDEFNRGTISEH